MKIRANILYLVICLGVSSLLLSGDELPEIRQKTSHPEKDFNAAVSPDGNYLAFVSDRSGNPDIWVKRLPRGRAVQVTSHPAEDIQPAWSPDGNSLAFVSKRHDALGDLWRVKIHAKNEIISNGKPKAVTTRFGRESHPSFSPDGRYLAYAREDSGMSNLHRLSLRSGKSRVLTTQGGTEPHWHPEDDWIIFTSFKDDPGGDLFLLQLSEEEKADPNIYQITSGPYLDSWGKWSPDGSQIAFCRFHKDTDKDQIITPLDNGAIWKKILTDKDHILQPSKVVPGNNEFQITSNFYQDFQPDWQTDDVLFFSSTRGEGEDIWSIPSIGLFQSISSAQEFYAQVQDKFAAAISDEALHQANLGYEQVLQRFPDSPRYSAQSLLRIADNLILLRDIEIAKTILYHVADVYTNQPREAAYARLKLASMASLPIDERISQCQILLNTEHQDRRIIPQVYLILGDLYHQLGREEESFIYFTEAYDEARNLRHLKAQALLKIGDFYKNDSQYENARQYYLSVLREFGFIPLWRDRANERLLSQIEGSTSERIQGYQEFFQYSMDLPATVASAQLQICQILIEQRQYRQAVQELEYIEQLVPTQDWAHAEAALLQAEVYRYMGDDLKAIILLEQVAETFKYVEGGIYIEKSNNRRFEILLESAQRIQRQGDVDLASARYEQAIRIKPQNLESHRGWIESQFRRGRIEVVLDFYNNQLLQEPENAVYTYCLGLAYSFQAEANRSIEGLQLSNTYLQSALEQNYRMIYPYRTLSYNYELLENLTEAEKNQSMSILKRTGHILASPVRWIAKLNPFRKDSEDTRYYELAIDALITAIEINDENENAHMEAILSQNLANNFYNLGEFGYKKALYYYQSRLSYDTTFSHPLERAVFYQRAGHAGAFVEDIESTDTYLNRAIREFEKLGRDKDVLLNQRRLAFFYQLTDQYEDAIPVYHNIIEKDLKAKRWVQLERDYRNLAYNYHLMGEPEDVLQFAYKAEQILKTKKLPKGEPKKNALRLGIFGVSIPVYTMAEIGASSSEGFTLVDEKTFVYALISQSNESLKHFDEAIGYEEKRLALFKKEKDNQAVRISLNRLGKLHFKKADYLSAWDYFNRSHYASKKSNDARGLWINAVNLGNVTTALISQEDNTTYLDQTIAILQLEYQNLNESSLATNEEKMGLLTNLANLIIYDSKLSIADDVDLVQQVTHTFNKLQALSQAEVYLNDAIQICREENHWEKEGILLKNLAEVSELSGDYESSYQRLIQSYSLFQHHGSQQHLWRVEYSLGQLIQNIPRNELNILIRQTPEYYYERAMNRLESLPVFEENSEERLSDRHDRLNLYKHAAFLYADKGQSEKALKTFERGREKQIADMLSRHPVTLKKERHKIVLGNLRYLRTRLYENQQEILQEEQGENRREVLANLQERYDRDWQDYAEVLHSVRDEDPVLSYLTGTESIRISAIQEILPEASAALVYCVDEDSSLLWIVSRDLIVSKNLSVGKNELLDLIQQFENIDNSDSDRIDSNSKLFNQLIRPANSFIDLATHLYIIPDGPLWNLSFGNLQSDGMSILEQYSISYLPSLTSYQLASQKRKINQESLFVFSDRDIDIHKESLDNSFSILNVHIPNKESIEFVEEKVQSFDVVHFKCGMTFNQSNPMLSQYVIPRKSWLLEDMFAWNLKSSLFVFQIPEISDCENDGFLMSLYAMLYAGAPSVIVAESAKPNSAPPWKTFYEQLHELGSAEALTEFILSNDNNVFHRIRLFGYEGMSSEARQTFARQNLESTVRKAMQLEQGREYEEAILTYAQSRDLASVVNDNKAGAAINQMMLRSAIRGELWQQAIDVQMDLYEEALSQNDISKEMTSLKNLTVFYSRNGDFNSAAEIKAQYIQLLKENGMQDQVAAQYEELAFIYSSGRQYKEAKEWIESAESLYRTLQDPLGQAKTLIRKGRFELEADHYYEARDALQNGLSILDTLKTSKEVLFEKASAHQLLGLTQEKLTQYKQAILSQKNGRELFDSIDMVVQAAQGTQYLANLYWKSGNYRQALEEQKEALAAFEKLNHQKLLSMAFSTRGLIQMSLGQTELAMQDQKTALELTRSTKSIADEATVLKNMALIQIQENAFPAAYDNLQRASELDSLIQFEAGMAYDYRNLGMVLLKLNNVEEAIINFEKGLILSDKIGDVRNQIHCHYGLAKSWNLKENYNKALSHLHDALERSEHLLVPELHWRLYREQGAIYKNMRKENNATASYKQAISIVENMRAELRVESFKQGFFDNKMDLYLDLITLLIENDQIREAFQYVERAKSRNFIDMLGNQSIQLTEAQQRYLDEEKEAREKLDEARTKLNTLRIQGDIMQPQIKDQIDDWEKILKERENAYQILLESIQHENAELASFVNVEPWSLSQIQGVLPDSTLLIEYFVSPEKLYIWQIGKNIVAHSEVNVTQIQLQKTVQSFRNTLQSYLSVDQNAMQLYKWLIEAVEMNMERNRHLVIVPHGILHYLPFAALKSSEGIYLIQSHSLSIAPSATVLGYCLQKGDERTESGNEVLAFGNPDLGNEDMDLPFAEKEVRSMERSYPYVESYFREDVTEKNVRQKSADADLLHFACHGTFVPDNPLFSALLLHSDETDDGRLEAHEIFGLKLNCDLVTLSACETGLAKITSGDEIIGLARSFIFAGTPSIITSLWKVDDLATAVMIKRFYRYYSAEMSRADALRMAQNLVRTAVNPHPAAWAAFTLTGDFR